MEHYHKFPKSLINFKPVKIERYNLNSNKLNKVECNIVKSQSVLNGHIIQTPYRPHETLELRLQQTDKNSITISNNKQIDQGKSCQSIQKPFSNDEQDRNFIYDTQSCKQLGDVNQDIVQSNNQIFQIVFMNKPKFKESFSTATSFVQNKNLQQQTNSIKVQDFSIGRKLGFGKFGEVFIAKHIQTGFLCALKKINKQNINQKLIIQLIRQIKIQSFLSHPNIVKLYNFFSDDQNIYLVMQICSCGQLYSVLKKKRKIAQKYTKAIISETLKALDYMHERQIIHRDLKPQNIVFINGMIKLCDFGWSISSKTMRQTFCGTPLYVSPQLLKRKNYNNKIDVWSLGILTYQLLFGRVPFNITTQRDFIKIVQDQIKFSKSTQISNDAKQFILICLQKDPRDRYTVAELLQHPFISKSQIVSLLQIFQ